VKKCNCSPDGFAQAVQMIAYYLLRGRVGTPYESVLAKQFKHGRVTVARNLSPVIAENIQLFATATDDVQKIQLVCLSLSLWRCEW
jgi:hypothetical protein